MERLFCDGTVNAEEQVFVDEEVDFVTESGTPDMMWGDRGAVV